MSLSAEDLMSDLSSVLGENAKATSIRGWLDTHLPELNWVIGGKYERGGPQGRMIEIFGPASAGKTFIATMLMRSVQEQKGIAFFSDHERSFSPEFAQTLGLSLDPAQFRHMKPQTFEDSIEAFIKVVRLVRNKGLPMEVPLIWVFDSVAAMIPRAKLMDDKGEVRKDADFNMRDKLALATCCSQNYPILKAFAEDYNCTVLILNQIRINPGQMFGDPTVTPGGSAAEFYADVRLSLGRKNITNGKKGPEQEVLGFEITAKSVKNKIARPFREARWQVRFDDLVGARVDAISTNLDFLIRRGIIPKDGTGRIEWEGKRVYVSAVLKELQDDPVAGNERLLKLVYQHQNLNDEDA